MTNAWWQPIRELNDAYFDGPSPGVSWQEHLRILNSKHHLSGGDELSTLPLSNLPPTWFIGDVTAVKPEDWILVLSLNPKLDHDSDWYTSRAWDADKFWIFQTQWFRGGWRWNSSFHGPLARLASIVLGRDDADKDLQLWAADHVVFAELCPYASDRFLLGPEVVASLSEIDPGCAVEAEIVNTMLQDGYPKLVFVNGNAALESFERLNLRFLEDWGDNRYPSPNSATKTLWHKDGYLHVRGRTIPVAAFPFLRKPRTHNSTAEIDDLGARIRTLLPAQ